MIYIDLENNPPLQEWIDRAEAIKKELFNAKTPEERNTIIDANENMWSELKGHLGHLSHNKCWYSESKNDGAHCHVDHFRPKKKAIDENGTDNGGYWWLAFDWLNYRYSSPIVNIRKRDYFHVNNNKANTPDESLLLEDIRFLDPTDIEDPYKLSFTNEGLVTPQSTDLQSRDYIQAEYTIRRMNLNKAEILDSRKDKFVRTQRLIRGTQDLIAQQEKNFCIMRRNIIKEKMKSILELASSCSEYSAAVKYCMRSSGLTWVNLLLERVA